MTLRRATHLVAFATLASAATVAAQRRGGFELGTFGQFTRYDPSLIFDDGLGIGGRLDVFLGSGLDLEGTIADRNFNRAVGSVRSPNRERQPTEARASRPRPGLECGRALRVVPGRTYADTRAGRPPPRRGGRGAPGGPCATSRDAEGAREYGR